MLGLDTQLALANSWNETAAQWMAAWSHLATGAMSQAAKACALPSETKVSAPTPRQPPARANGSWYQPPVSNPFALPIFGFSFGAPMPWMAPTDLMGAFQQSFQFWDAMLKAARFTFNPIFPGPTFALGFIPNWTMWAQPQIWQPSTTKLPAPPTAFPPTPKAPFVAYRSDSGHAVTQVTFPNNVVAAIALPASAAPGFAAWPSVWNL